MKKITIKQYNLDLEMISIQKFQEMLKNHNLLPGRRILLQKIDEYFS